MRPSLKQARSVLKYDVCAVLGAPVAEKGITARQISRILGASETAVDLTLKALVKEGTAEDITTPRQRLRRYTIRKEKE